MPLLGAHMSIVGGYDQAVLRAADLGMTCVQLFTKNNNQWRAKPIGDAEAAKFVDAIAITTVQQAVAHNSYLINLASWDDALWARSIEAMVVEVRRAAKLGIVNLVAHPGAHNGHGEDAGVARIADALCRILEKSANTEVRIALETTAGQGTSIGYRFEHLADIISRCDYTSRIRVCLDTCHLFAAGYPLAPRRKYSETMRRLDKTIGFDRLVAVHVNDSKKPLGSRVDRHEHIGHGCLGRDAFRLLMNDRRLKDMPLILETPKGTDPRTGKLWDKINIETLRRLVQIRH